MARLQGGLLGEPHTEQGRICYSDGMLLLLLVWSAIAGMTLNMETVAVTGVELRAVHCELNSGGLLASIGVVASVAEQKAALDACAPAGAAAQVGWTWKDGKVAETTVQRIEGKAQAACIQAALKRTVSGIDGVCQAVILLGPAEAAVKAADVLAPPPPAEVEAAPAPEVAPEPPPEPAPEPPKKRGIGL